MSSGRIYAHMRIEQALKALLEELSKEIDDNDFQILHGRLPSDEMLKRIAFRDIANEASSLILAELKRARSAKEIWKLARAEKEKR